MLLDGSHSSDPDGEIVSWKWYINGALKSQDDRYSARLSVGTYDVTLEVSDDKNATSRRSAEVVVRESPISIAGVSPTLSGSVSTSPSPPLGGQQFNFTLSGSNFDPSTVEAFFLGPGCGTSISCVVPNGNLTASSTSVSGPATLAAGSFTVQVRNGSGGTASNTRSLTVDAGPETEPNQDPTAGMTMSYGGQSAFEGTNLNLTVAEGEEVNVNFSASRSSDSDGDIVAWEWRISNTVVSNAADFSRRLGAGNHVIQLTVTDDDGATATSPGGTGVVITETAPPNQSPTARITMSHGGQSAFEGSNLNVEVAPGGRANVSFSASRSSDPDGTITAWQWRISGSLVSNSSSFSFELGEGNHVIQLTVTDDDGATATSPGGTGVVITETAPPNQSPTARITMSHGGQSAFEGSNLNVEVAPGGRANVSFSASRSSDPDGTITAWQWRISGSLVSPASSFSFELGEGNHVIQLTVTDDDGATATSPGGTGVVITETAPPNQSPTARITMSHGGQSAFEGSNLNVEVAPGGRANVSFSASRSSDPDGTITAWQWRISGSLVSPASSFSFELGEGNHVIQLTVTDDDGATATSPGGTGVVITEAVPVISSTNPSSPTSGPDDQNITVFGSGFQPNLTVSVGFPGGGGGTLNPPNQIQSVSANSFVMRITLGSAGAYTIRVNNPVGPSSNTFGFNAL